MKIKFAVIVFPGSNCDYDAYYALKNILNVDVDFVWHKETRLSNFDIILIPGGFSYGDYLRTGAIARFSPIMGSIISESKKGKPIIGICNGFQILLECGLLPGALINNENIKFLNVCKFGFFLDTTLKLDFEKEKSSRDCTKILLDNDDILCKLLLLNLLASIILKFFLIFNSFKASLSILLQIITSKNIFLNSMASFLLIL